MRVAILRRAPEISFSMDIYADSIIRELKTVRPNWEILEISPEPWWKEQSEKWKAGLGIKKYYERFWRHPKFSSEQDVDLFHIVDHSDGHLVYWLKRTGKPVIVTCHDLVQLVYPEILKDQSSLPALSMAVWKYSVSGLQQADRIISVSSNTAQDISNFLEVHPSKISVIHNAVDSSFSQLHTRGIDAIHKPIRLLNVGSTHYRKNIITVLKVVENLRSWGREAVLWRVGEALTTEQNEYIKEHRLQDAIVNLGNPTQQHLIKIYNDADYLLAPSLYEGFGLTILEAMACGLPVIASNVSSLPEVAGDAAVLESPTDVDRISKRILELSENNDSRQSYVQKGLNRARKFTWEQTTLKIAELYESTCMCCL